MGAIKIEVGNLSEHHGSIQLPDEEKVRQVIGRENVVQGASGMFRDPDENNYGFDFPSEGSTLRNTLRITRAMEEANLDIDVLLPRVPATKTLADRLMQDKESGVRVYFLPEKSQEGTVAGVLHAHKRGAAVLKALPRKFRHAA